MMHAVLFTVFRFAAAAYSASIPRAESQLKPFQISGFNFTQAAGSDAANVRFNINEPNTGDTTVCGDDVARPNELRFCNGLPQYVFSDDFKTLSVSWVWGPGGPQDHTCASGSAEVRLNCVDGSSEAGKKECTVDDFSLPITVAP